MYNPDRTVRFATQPFGSSYTGGARVAVGDVTGDGVADVVAVTNGGTAAKARIIDGATGTVLPNDLLGATTYTGNVALAVGDMTGDGVADIALGTNLSNARVRVWRGGDYELLSDFRSGPTTKFVGGTQLGIGDMTGDGLGELVVSSRYTTGTRVVGYAGSSVVLGQWPEQAPEKAFKPFVLGNAYVKGLFLAVGDVTGDGVADVAVGTAAGVKPSVVVYSGEDLASTNTRTKVAVFTPAQASSKAGVRLAMRDVDGDGQKDLVTSSGEMVSAFEGGVSLPPVGLPPVLFAFDPNPSTTGGVWVG
jgi:hypothetical protein